MMDVKDVLETKSLLGTNKEYSSKSTGGTALGFGIAGTALALFGGLLGFGAWESGGLGRNRYATSNDAEIRLMTQMYDTQLASLAVNGSAREKDLLEKESLMKAIYDLNAEVQAMRAVQPYVQEINNLHDKMNLGESLAYTKEQMCNVVKGQVVLPSGSTVTGFTGAACPGGLCNCNPPTTA